MSKKIQLVNVAGDTSTTIHVEVTEDGDRLSPLD